MQKTKRLFLFSFLLSALLLFGCISNTVASEVENIPTPQVSQQAASTIEAETTQPSPTQQANGVVDSGDYGTIIEDYMTCPDLSELPAVFVKNDYKSSLSNWEYKLEIREPITEINGWEFNRNKIEVPTLTCYAGEKAGENVNYHYCQAGDRTASEFFQNLPSSNYLTKTIIDKEGVIQLVIEKSPIIVYEIIDETNASYIKTIC